MDSRLLDHLSGVCQSPYAPLHPDPSFRLDEGYAEDARSIDDGDSAMGLEPRNLGAADLLDDPFTALHNAVMNLNERQRSGELVFHESQVQASKVKILK